ncbi:MAG: hypothetical protein KDD67_17105 [Ignavibacteriae bacterium]|nr:hypothetical protein [Ignavibacteriota bacterium]MCB9214276.1 hypothetical protein [Ignavibacteria bacterium]
MNIARYIIATTFLILTLGLHLNAQDLERVGKESPVKLSGAISSRLVGYGVSGIENRRDPFSALVAGNVTLDLYGLQLPFSFSWSTQDRSFSQPFNQFGASPQYKWATAHLGYRNLSFSPYTLSGHQMLGAGVELMPGDFRASFIAGELQQGVQVDTADTLNIVEPVYRRTGYAGRLGYGNNGFSVDLSFLKAADDTTSLRNTIAENANVRPGENLVVGATFGLKPANNLTFKIDGAVSSYTRDVRSDSIALSDEAEAFGDVITPRASTQIYTALRADANYYGNVFSMNANYTRIDPDYQSMGAYYTSGDVESVSIAPSLAVANRKLTFNGSFTWGHDNLQGKKLATTENLSPSLTMNWSPSASFGILLTGSTQMISQSEGTLPVNDTTRLHQQTPMVMVAPRYMITDTTFSHAFFLTATHQRLLDNNTFTASYSEYNTTIASLSYTLTGLKSSFSVTGSLTGTRMENLAGEQITTSVSLGGSKGLFKEKLGLNGSISATLGENSRTVALGLGGIYRTGDHHSFNLNFSTVSANGSDEIKNSTFTEYTGIAGYAYRF